MSGDTILTMVVCNGCDLAITPAEMDARFGTLAPLERLTCTCGSQSFAWRGEDEDGGETVDFDEARLTMRPNE